jgi:hypothetical protein
MQITPDIPLDHTPERPGDTCDLALLREDSWLMDTEVIYQLLERRSLWYLTIVYVAIENPFKLICRKIDTYNSQKKAEVSAKIIQRGIRKDARGTLKANKDAFYICAN